MSYRLWVMGFLSSIDCISFNINQNKISCKQIINFDAGIDNKRVEEKKFQTCLLAGR
jgi:hypothetical protein